MRVLKDLELNSDLWFIYKAMKILLAVSYNSNLHKPSYYCKPGLVSAVGIPSKSQCRASVAALRRLTKAKDQKTELRKISGSMGKKHILKGMRREGRRLSKAEPIAYLWGAHPVFLPTQGFLPSLRLPLFGKLFPYLLADGSFLSFVTQLK